MKSTHIKNIYLFLILLNTLAASLIWGINTLFLLDAGLTNTEAFAANAFFTVGQVLFEVPTGVIADMWGRRTSYILGTLTLAASTILYFLAWQTEASFIWWAVSSILLGLGFTFFSGATEAWLVDALAFTGFKGTLESVFAKAQIVGGVAMLVGAVGGGLIAQATNLGVPYILRAILLVINFLAAYILMRDLGFTPKRTSALRDMKNIVTTSINYGFSNHSVRWVMIAAPFTTGVGFYVFYAMQPYLLELYGDNTAYGIAGLAAAIVAGAQIVGGLSVPYIKKICKRRTSVLVWSVVLGTLLLIALGFVTNFWVAIALFIIWGLVGSAAFPVRQAYLNGLIPSNQRATVLSFDSLMGSSGGIVIQPVLGRVADLGSYPLSYLVASGFQLLALPFTILARKQNPKSDLIA